MDLPVQIKAEWSDVMAFVDTNVALDIYTAADVLRDHERLGIVDLEHRQHVYRRARARESLLLAMFFNDTKAVTYGLHQESKRQVLRASPPDDHASFGTHYTKFFVRFVHERLLPDWRDTWEIDNDAGLQGQECDDRLLALAAEHSLPIITNEGFTPDGFIEDPKKLRQRARARGLAVYTPREFWSGKMDEAVRIDQFLSRFCAEASKYISTHRSPPMAHDSLSTILGYYKLVLLGITEGRDKPVSVTLPWSLPKQGR